MKPKDYVKKYDLSNKEVRLNGNAFVQDLAVDFTALIETHQRYDWNYTKFRLCVQDIRKKFNSICNRTAHPDLNEKLWKYFYAKIVGPMKDEMFGEFLEKERQRKRQEQEYQTGFIFEMLFGRILEMMSRTQPIVPEDSFRALGLSSAATLDEIKAQYKRLALEHHPDRGGKQSTFVALTEARNRCLLYVGNN